MAMTQMAESNGFRSVRRIVFIGFLWSYDLSALSLLVTKENGARRLHGLAQKFGMTATEWEIPIADCGLPANVFKGRHPICGSVQMCA
jgi:hypothetical protein